MTLPRLGKLSVALRAVGRSHACYGARALAGATRGDKRRLHLYIRAHLNVRLGRLVERDIATELERLPADVLLLRRQRGHVGTQRQQPLASQRLEDEVFPTTAHAPRRLPRRQHNWGRSR